MKLIHGKFFKRIHRFIPRAYLTFRRSFIDSFCYKRFFVSNGAIRFSTSREQLSEKRRCSSRKKCFLWMKFISKAFSSRSPRQQSRQNLYKESKTFSARDNFAKDLKQRTLCFFPPCRALCCKPWHSIHPNLMEFYV